MSYNTSNNFSVTTDGVLGTIKEKAQLAAFYFTGVQRAVVKATNREIVEPKAKHVQSIQSKDNVSVLTFIYIQIYLYTFVYVMTFDSVDSFDMGKKRELGRLL